MSIRNTFRRIVRLMGPASRLSDSSSDRDGELLEQFGKGRLHCRLHRSIRVEQLEPRQLMAADIRVGAVYIEQDSGQDAHPDKFYIAFEGGAPNTQLKRLVINGDHGQDGLSASDMIFDTTRGGLGADESAPFVIESLLTKNPNATVKATVADGSSLLILDFTNFVAGDKLIFTIDVDEVQHFDRAITNPAEINDGIDPIASGVEFQDSHLTAEFIAPHYENVSETSKFKNVYDSIVDPLDLSLPRDNQTGQRDRTTGAGLTARQTPKPISLTGTVWVDSDEDLTIDAGESRLSGIQVELFKLQGSNYISTGLTSLTDSTGRYDFAAELKLQPGTYQVRQTQPADYYSVGATLGQLNSAKVGQLVANDPNKITNIELPLGDSHAKELNFAENLPATLAGHVCYVTSGMDCFSSSSVKAPQANVLVELLDSAGKVIATSRSGSDGSYRFVGLRAGSYALRQTNQAGKIDGGAQAGSSGGRVVDANNISQIIIGGGVQAADYDFCDLIPAQLSGHTYIDVNNNGIRDTTEAPLANVLVELRDQSGAVIASTRTDSLGFYEFTGIQPGVYSVTEHTPQGYLPGKAAAGSLGGQTDATGDLIKSISLGSGANAVNYDFGELLLSSISGYVFVDADQDCLRDLNEQPIAGVLISLLDATGAVVATTQTDAQGGYQFNHLVAGVYSIRQTQPAGYLQGGQRAGSAGGNDSVQDIISQIALAPGADVVDYTFCELLPASLAGSVYVDSNLDCIRDPGELGLAGVRVELLDGNGKVVAQTVTDQVGRYTFTNLRPGDYSVREVQPVGYFQGGQKAGSGGGDDSAIDLISAINVQSGDQLIDYDFCELEPGSIAGAVFADVDLDCFQDANELGLSGVQIQLLDQGGRIVQVTSTDQQGRYAFAQLAPGTYSVRELQPQGYFQGGQMAPTTGGDDSQSDLISQIVLAAGQAITNVDFCENPPAQLSGYVFKDGADVDSPFGRPPENLHEIRDGIRTNDDQPLAEVVIRLFAADGQPMRASAALPGIYSGQFVQTRTDALGHYQFVGLPAGIYYVAEVQPQGYVDYIDTPGSTGGSVLLATDEVNLFRAGLGSDAGELGQLSDSELMDVILAIQILPGDNSVENNFSEIKLNPVNPVPPIGTPPGELVRPEVVPMTFPGFQPLAFSALQYRPLPLILGAVGVSDTTWHLSIINGGTPRGERNGEEITPEYVADNADLLNMGTWTVRGMRASNFRYVSLTAEKDKSNSVFYIPGAKPLMGDFNGDGFDELALFLEGEWFIDLNGNGRWDEADIWLKMGTKGDQPVVGDWDGDGKDDVGVFGKRWAGDDRALATEPGMPDPDHFLTSKRPKNMPRQADETPENPRLMQPSREGRARADVIDHVFRLGSGRDIAIAGQFNEDLVATLGTFRDGQWKIDTTGDGKPNKIIQFGEKGDLPLVGDFINQDGVDEIAIVRGNKVIVDSNGNGKIDVTDQVFLLESTEGTVIVGDFDGDGNDEPALYQTPEQQRGLQARRNAG